MIGKSGVALGRFQELAVCQHHPNSANPVPRYAVSVGPGPDMVTGIPEEAIFLKTMES
ncbi:MAG: hypothetical protein ACK2UP_03620 [Candidatus Promineifilaceae bacterium]